MIGKGTLWWSIAALIALFLLGLFVRDAGRAGMVGEDPRIILHGQEGGMDAEVRGLLEYDPGSRCLFLRHDNGSLSAPLWPAGTRPTLRDGRRGVEVPGHGPILEGDPVAGGGGEISGEEAAPLNIPDVCRPQVAYPDTGLLVVSYLS